MLLDVDNTLPYLVEHHYLHPRAIVEGDAQVISSARRNRNLRVTRAAGGGMLLKQAEARGSEATLGAEADFYRLCSEDERAAEVRALIPRLVGVEPNDHLLIIELFQSASSLLQHEGDFGASGLLVDVGRALGRALGTCHRALRSFVESPTPTIASLPSTAPWVLWVHRPGPDILSDISAANMQTLRILQRNATLSRHLDRLRRGWRGETLIHNDIKADNILVLAQDEAEPESPESADARAPLEIKLVDWELVQVGDPAWDVGAALKDFLGFWIGSMPITAGMPAAQMAAQAAHPLTRFQAGLRGLWQAYRSAAQLPREEAAPFLLRAVQYAAAWLVQSAYEGAQRSSRLGNHSVMMLQISANIFKDPKAAAPQLFGIPL